MKISVVIPSYRPQEYLWECLNSLNKQTFPKEDFEIILVLNGCNEPYYGMISSFISNYLVELNIKLIQLDKGSVSYARNIGIENAKGDYITFIDDDDYVSESYLQEMYDVSLCGYTPISNMIAFDDLKGEIMPYYISDLFQKRKSQEFCKQIEVRSYLSIPVAKLLHCDVIGDCRFNERYRNGEDSLFVFQISNKIGRLKCTSEKAVYFRRCRNGSATTKKHNVSDVVKNAVSLCLAYTKTIILNPFSYNYIFYFSRILGAYKSSRNLLKSR